jgi:hypothetical protein
MYVCNLLMMNNRVYLLNFFITRVNKSSANKANIDKFINEALFGKNIIFNAKNVFGS